MGSQKAWDILNLARTTAYYVNYWKSPCTAENVLSQQNEKQSKAAWIFFFLILQHVWHSQEEIQGDVVSDLKSYFSAWSFHYFQTV